MANNNSFDNIMIYVNQNSQVGQAADPSNRSDGKKELKDYYKEMENLETKVSKKAQEKRIADLRKQYDTEAELQEAINKDLAEIEAYEQEKRAKDRKQQLKDTIEYGATLQERKDAERQLKQQETIDSFVDKIGGTIDTLFDKIKNSGKEYADYVERIEVGLLGTTKDYESVTSKLDKVFSMNVFFSMKDALERTAKMIDDGIAYNVELRSSLGLFSEKMAKTFDAMDDTLLRLVKIQQADSTQARLGMESLLLNYLNSNFQNSEYLHGLSDQVSAAILEASSQKSRNESVEFEYSVQKWLGSLSSVGVSDQAIMALAQGLGYLGSGNVGALTSNTNLQQLMAISASRGGGKSYGEMLTTSLNASDVSSILTGFYSLAEEINGFKRSGNLVAMNQYANLFGLTVSDITSILNLSSENIKAISNDMASYNQTLSQVERELSSGRLKERTAYSKMVDNIQNNLMASIGMDMASNLGANVKYLAAELAAGIVENMDLGTEIHPWGVGASIDIDPAKLIKGGMVTGSYLSAVLGNISAITSALSPNLSKLGGEDTSTIKILGGGGAGQLKTGQTTNQVTYIGRTDNSSVYSTVSQESKKQTSEVLQRDVDEESKKMDNMSQTLIDIRDDVNFIVQLLNVNGIKVRDFGNTIASYLGYVATNNNSGNFGFFQQGR